MKKYKFIFYSILVLVLFYYSIPLPDPLFRSDYSTVVLDHNDKILRVFLTEDEQWCFPPNPDLQIPEKLKTAVIQFEDKYFYNHSGINAFSVLRALYQNITSGEIESGASTLTMQVARLMNRQPRTYLNKILEMLQAVKIETKYSKEEILRLYLDHAPYGGNIVGYQAASLRYFHRMPEKLTWGQAATLAVLPNAPGLVSPQSDSKKLELKRNQLLKQLRDNNLIDNDIYELACLEEVPNQSTPLGFNAPHLCRYLKSKENHPALIKTTIDKTLQQRLEEIIVPHAEYLNSSGIKNCAALVVETQSGKVKAYIGSDDFFDSKALGQVDGVLAPRSSGSILKPFLYALSMDEGYILPQSLIKDVPSFYGSFSPANADLRYRGIVTAKEALVHSYNVPAVRLLNKYGFQSFYYFLKEAGLSSLFREHEEYGLPLILGGAETTLWDMAALYRGLALYGRFENIKVLREEKENKNIKQLISRGACYLTLNILKELNRPGSEYYWQQYQNQWPLAWKTGTSYGQRDGWAIGINPEWTIAVWVGNFHGQGNANLTGAASAGPLLFDIFNILPKNPEKHWFEKYDMDLKEVQLCQNTGYVAGENCPQTIGVSAPRFMKSMQICPYHKKIFVNKTNHKQVCSLCWNDEVYYAESILIYPPDVTQYLRKNGQVVESIPAHNASCPAIVQGNPLQIVYPQPNASLWIPRDFGGELQKISCRVAHQQKDCRIYWYLDDQYKGVSEERHELALHLDKGWHDLLVVDENGNRSQVRFYTNLRD